MLCRWRRSGCSSSGRPSSRAARRDRRRDRGLHVLFLLAPPFRAHRPLQLPRLRAARRAAASEPLRRPAARRPRRSGLRLQQLAPAAQSRTGRCSRCCLLPTARLPLPVAYWSLQGARHGRLAGAARRGLGRGAAARPPPAAAVAFVGLNPVVLVYALGGKHNDLLHDGLPDGRRAAAARRRELLAARRWRRPSRSRRPPGCSRRSSRFARAAARPRAVAGLARRGGVLARVSLLAFGAHLPDVPTRTGSSAPTASRTCSATRPATVARTPPCAASRVVLLSAARSRARSSRGARARAPGGRLGRAARRALRRVADAVVHAVGAAVRRARRAAAPCARRPCSSRCGWRSIWTGARAAARPRAGIYLEPDGASDGRTTPSWTAYLLDRRCQVRIVPAPAACSGGRPILRAPRWTAPLRPSPAAPQARRSAGCWPPVWRSSRAAALSRRPRRRPRRPLDGQFARTARSTATVTRAAATLALTVDRAGGAYCRRRSARAATTPAAATADGCRSTFSTPAGKRRRHVLDAQRLTLTCRGGSRRGAGGRRRRRAAPDRRRHRSDGVAGTARRARLAAGLSAPTTRAATTPSRAARGAAPATTASRRCSTPAASTWALLTESGLTREAAAHMPSTAPARDPARRAVRRRAGAAHDAVAGRRRRRRSATVVRSDLATDLGRPSRIRDTSWIQPGRVGMVVVVRPDSPGDVGAPARVHPLRGRPTAGSTCCSTRAGPTPRCRASRATRPRAACGSMLWTRWTGAARPGGRASGCSRSGRLGRRRRQGRLPALGLRRADGRLRRHRARRRAPAPRRRLPRLHDPARHPAHVAERAHARGGRGRRARDARARAARRWIRARTSTSPSRATSSARWTTRR